MKRGNVGNVLVIGNSGVGKSTLINAVLGEKKQLQIMAPKELLINWRFMNQMNRIKFLFA